MNETPTFNDLVGLPFRWAARPADGATDCFQLACEAARRYGRGDYAPLFAWVYQRFSEDSIPRSLVYRLLRQHGIPIERPIPGAVGFFSAGDHGALATVTDHGLLLVGPGRAVIHLPAAAAPQPDRLFWFR